MNVERTSNTSSFPLSTISGKDFTMFSTISRWLLDNIPGRHPITSPSSSSVACIWSGSLLCAVSLILEIIMMRTNGAQWILSLQRSERKKRPLSDCMNENQNRDSNTTPMFCNGQAVAKPIMRAVWLGTNYLNSGETERMLWKPRASRISSIGARSAYVSDGTAVAQHSNLMRCVSWSFLKLKLRTGTLELEFLNGPDRISGSQLEFSAKLVLKERWV